MKETSHSTDMKLMAATLEALVGARPAPTPAQPQHLCLDAGYDYPVIWQTVREQGYEPHIRPQRQERANAGGADPLKRPRRLLVRWEKLQRTYEAFVHLACALLCFQQCDRLKALSVSE